MIQQNSLLDTEGNYKNDPAGFNPIGYTNFLGANEVGARGLSGNVTGVKLVSNKTVSGSSAPTVKNTATAHNIGIVKTGGQIDFDGTNSYATHKMSLETQDIAALASQTDLLPNLSRTMIYLRSLLLTKNLKLL